jgi:hypothetical protein
MKRHLLLTVIALGGLAWATGAGAGPSQAATDTAVATCKTQYAAGGMTTVQLWQCANQAELAFEKSNDPLNMDLYRAAATRNEQVAGLFDTGKISKAQADSLYDATDAEVQKTLKGRRETLEDRPRSSCGKYSDVSGQSNTICY